MVNVVDPVVRRASADPTSVAVRRAGGPLSYAALLRGALAFGVRLRAAGAARGDRVVLIAPSVPEFVTAYLGAQALGCVVVPVNTMATEAEISYVLDDAGPAVVVGWHELGPAHRQAARSRGVPVLVLETGASVNVPLFVNVGDRVKVQTSSGDYMSRA